MKKKFGVKTLSVFAATTLALTACGTDEKENTGGKTKTPTGEDANLGSNFPLKVSNSAESIEGGMLTFGLVSDTPFEGTLNYNFYQGAPDFDVISFFDEALLGTDENFVYNQSGAATYEISEDNKTITLKIRDNVNWHDGKPVTAHDLEYAYQVIADKDYKGVRLSSIIDVEGVKEYNEGKADAISGIKVEDDKTISITFKEPTPSLLTGVWSYPLHKEYYKDVAIKDMAAADQTRVKPIGFGPFKVKSITAGEAVEFEANKDYWQGAPKLDGILLKVVSSQAAVASLQNGDIDFLDLPTDVTTYESAKKLENIEILGKTDLAYTYIGIKLGSYDAEKKTSVMDRTKLSDKRVRQALAWAINNDAIGEKFYGGLREGANSVIPPSHPKYTDSTLEGYSYNPEKAKELLDAAGFKDTNGDGIREDADGKEFVLNFASMSGGDTAEPIAQQYIQWWKDVGINVQLFEGRLHEFNSFYDLVEKDDPGIDIYQAAWGVGSDPDPSGIWKSDAAFNYPRWNNAESDQLLADGVSQKAFDETFRVDTYKKWQNLVSEEVPVIPTLFRSTLMAVNKRVKDFDYTNGAWAPHEWSVTADKAVK